MGVKGTWQASQAVSQVACTRARTPWEASARDRCAGFDHSRGFQPMPESQNAQQTTATADNHALPLVRPSAFWK